VNGRMVAHAPTLAKVGDQRWEASA
jgi:hypothetical protein